MGKIRELAGRWIGGRGGVVRNAGRPPVGGNSMKKYNTRPIDFTGCHPVIAEHLKRGEAIECRVWDSGREHDKGKGYVTGYESGIHITSGGFDWDHAEPITLKTRHIMPPCIIEEVEDDE